MKRAFLTIVAALASLVVLASCDNDEKHLDYNELPNVAKSFINNHFGDNEVRSVIKEYDDLTYHYEVYLTDGTKIEFNKNGEWREVENRVEGVPTSILPAGIISYVQENYGGYFIVSVERDRQYDIELNNDLDLDFTLDGDFIRVDY